MSELTDEEIVLALEARRESLLWATYCEILFGRRPTDDEIALYAIEALERRLIVEGG